MEKLNWKIFQTHMQNFLFGDSVLVLNYKYYQVTSSAKNFSKSFYSWRCRSKEYPPKSTPIWGVLVQMSVWKGYVVKRLKNTISLRIFPPKYTIKIFTTPFVVHHVCYYFTCLKILLLLQTRNAMNDVYFIWNSSMGQ